MTRVERARLIVARIRALAKDRGCWVQDDDTNQPRLQIDVGEGWTAMTYSPLADALATIRECGYQVNLGFDETARKPIVVDVWVDGKKVLSAESDGDNFALRSMKPGSWEDWFFAAPVAGHC